MKNFLPLQGYSLDYPRSILGVLLGALLLMPSFATATIEVTTSGSGSINNTTSASSDSGGQTAPGGQNVSTGGTSASAKVKNTISADESGGGTIESTVVMEVNGEVYTETIKKEIPPDGIAVQVSFFKDLWEVVWGDGLGSIWSWLFGN